MASLEAPPIMDARMEREMPLIQSEALTVDMVVELVFNVSWGRDNQHQDTQ